MFLINEFFKAATGQDQTKERALAGVQRIIDKGFVLDLGL